MHHPVHPSPVVADSLQIRPLANIGLSCCHTLREAEQIIFLSVSLGVLLTETKSVL